MVGNGCLKEEWEIGKNWAHGLFIDLHSCEEFAQDNHVHHYWDCKEWVFAYVIGHDCVCAIHENLWAVLIDGPLWISDKRNISDDDVMVDLGTVLFDSWIKNLIRFYGIIKHPSLWQFLRLEALVFWKILSIVVSQMIIGNYWTQSNSTPEQIVRHNCLEPCLTWLKITSSDEALMLVSIFDNRRMESVLRGPI